MARYRISLHGSMSLTLALAIASIGLAQGSATPTADTKPAAVSHIPTCKIYPLSDLGDDADLAKWVAATIPEMIQPATWKDTDVKLSYFAPSRILVINHTAAVHVQVEEFIQSLKKSLPTQKAMTTKRDTQIVPAQYPLAEPVRSINPVQPAPNGYAVPQPTHTPKHLFHFIIRYEGDGIIDSNVVKFMKAQSNQDRLSMGGQGLGLQPVDPLAPTQGPNGIRPPGPHYLNQPAEYIPSPPTQILVQPKNAPLMPPADPLPANPAKLPSQVPLNY